MKAVGLVKMDLFTFGSCGELVDEAFYCLKYPDAALFRYGGEQHFKQFGQFEGRLPTQSHLPAILLLRNRGLVSLASYSLQDYACTGYEKALLLYLRIWIAWSAGQPNFSIELCTNYIKCLPKDMYISTLAIGIAQLAAIDEEDEAKIRYFNDWLSTNAPPKYSLINSLNSSVNRLDDEAWLSILNFLWKPYGLLPVEFRASTGFLFDRIGVHIEEKFSSQASLPRVSVVISTYNSECTVRQALSSVFSQSWANIELVLVNDASTDRTENIVSEFLSRNVRGGFRTTQVVHSVNQGAYAARNAGVAAATGDFVTVHDADDWSHPEKIEKQVQALIENPSLKASVSHWVRMTPEGLVLPWKFNQNWVHRNVSSLMFRREVIEELGYWDEVRSNADTEYYYRVITAYGAESIKEVMPGVPLAFGRVHEKSLTQSADTHIYSQYVGDRKNYMDAARRWHKRVKDKTELYMEKGAKIRPFLAPEKMLSRPQEVKAPLLEDRWQQSKWWDTPFYLQEIPDLFIEEFEPFEHFWDEGRDLLINPSAKFSAIGYNLVSNQGVEKFIDSGLEVGLFQVVGGAVVDSNNPWICVIGNAGRFDTSVQGINIAMLMTQLAGAGYNIHLVLSSQPEQGVEWLVQSAHRVSFVPMLGWLPNRPVDADVQNNLLEYIQHNNPVACIALGALHLECMTVCELLALPIAILLNELPRCPAYIFDKNKFFKPLGVHLAEMKVGVLSRNFIEFGESIESSELWVSNWLRQLQSD